MNGPYYRNYSRSVPVHKPKVVSIPVHFISSDHQPQTNKHSSSALKIQKVFKGHTVRKALNKIVSIKNQVNEIEERLQSDDVFVRTLRNDAKERLRVNETLMSLLFKLDSVRGVGNGVRDVRKSVAKKAVALQEKVDFIAQTFEEGDDDVSNDEKAEFDDVSNEEDVVDDDVSNKTRDQQLVANQAMNEDSMKKCDDDVSINEETEFCDVSNGVGNEMNGEDAKEEGVVDDDVINDEKTELCDVSIGIRNRVNADDVVDDDVSNKNHDQELVVKEVMNEDSTKECDYDVSRNNVDSIGQTFEDYDDDVSNEEYMKDVVSDDVSNNVGNQESVDDKEMVEKLVIDNAKMMRLMRQISERNEMQTRMINSLSRRVEQLEKAFIMSDKSRRRKKSYTRREKDGICI